MALKVFLHLLVELIGLRAVISAHLAQVQCRRLQPCVWIASANQSRGVAQNIVFGIKGESIPGKTHLNYPPIYRVVESMFVLVNSREEFKYAPYLNGKIGIDRQSYPDKTSEVTHDVMFLT